MLFGLHTDVGAKRGAAGQRAVAFSDPTRRSELGDYTHTGLQAQGFGLLDLGFSSRPLNDLAEAIRVLDADTPAIRLDEAALAKILKNDVNRLARQT